MLQQIFRTIFITFSLKLIGPQSAEFLVFFKSQKRYLIKKSYYKLLLILNLVFESEVFEIKLSSSLTHMLVNKKVWGCEHYFNISNDPFKMFFYGSIQIISLFLLVEIIYNFYKFKTKCY